MVELAKTTETINPVDKVWNILSLVVLLLVLGSALGVIYSSFMSRQLFSELEVKKRDASHMEEEWGRLLLEQSTWASPARIEDLAKKKLEMIVPNTKTMVVVYQ